MHPEPLPVAVVQFREFFVLSIARQLGLTSFNHDLRPAFRRCGLQLSSGPQHVFQAELSALHPSSRANLWESHLHPGWRQIRLVILEGLMPSSVRNWRP